MKSEKTSLKILYIDDNKDLADLLRMILEQMGHKCVTAFDGEEGIRKAYEYVPDIVFCDIGLPKVDGFEVAKTIRNSDQHKNMILVAVTGYTQQKNLDTALESGYEYIVAKPFDMSVIQNVLDLAYQAVVV